MLKATSLRNAIIKRFLQFNDGYCTRTKGLKTTYDVVVIGAGHNGLVTAGYLGKAGLKVCVLERRHVVGGAAVTEEIVPGFKFSRASYVLSLLRPQIFKDLELRKHGLKVHLRNPYSYTPLLNSDNGPNSLTFFTDRERTIKEIARFSRKDAEMYPLFERRLEHFVAAIQSLLDNPPPNYSAMVSASFRERFQGFLTLRSLLKTRNILGKDLLSFYELATTSVNKFLDQWFVSEPLKATLAMDGVIGAMHGPGSPGSAYVLLHHCMGELEGVKGAWGYPEGGMGAVTQALAKAALSHGVHIATSSTVKQILFDDDDDESVEGVSLEDGTVIKSKYVFSNATPKITFIDLLPKGVLSDEQLREVSRIDYSSPVTKINLALKSLPNFLADPNVRQSQPMPHHQTTIHLNCEKTQLIQDAYIAALQGKLPEKPMIEMVIPSSLDSTLAPQNCHVCLLFTQYTPYTLAQGKKWNKNTKKEYLDIVINSIEEYAPGFHSSVIGGEVLSPVDLEEIFGLTGGNIFHGALSLDQMFVARPLSSVTSPRTPVSRLYLCGSGAHPGGGVMGASGRLAALSLLRDLGKKKSLK